jgi:hypothetical protein
VDPVGLLLLLRLWHLSNLVDPVDLLLLWHRSILVGLADLLHLLLQLSLEHLWRHQLLLDLALL